MRPLTDRTPKPLLEVRGRPLIEWHLRSLAAGGFRRLAVNVDWLGEQIVDRYGAQPVLPGIDGPLSIAYSDEGLDFGGALETAGGIARALPLLDEVFWVLAGDIYAPQFGFTERTLERFAASDKLAHLWLVPNPPQHPLGDFGLSGKKLALRSDAVQFTFSTIALYRREFFAALPFGNPDGHKAPLAPMLRTAMDNQQVSAELYRGPWADVGTPERLAQLNHSQEQRTP